MHLRIVVAFNLILAKFTALLDCFVLTSYERLEY